MTNVVLNGNAYSDDGTSSRDMQGGGHRQWLLPMLGDAVVEVNAPVQGVLDAAFAANASAAAALISENAADQSAQDAQDLYDLAFALGSGWTAVTAAVVDGVRTVLEVTDWVGGKGPKPAVGYVGASGLVADIANGTNIRGAVAYADLTGKPTLGTAAPLNVPAVAASAAGDSEVVRGDDPRLAATATRGTQLYTTSQNIAKSTFGTAEYVFVELWAGGGSGAAGVPAPGGEGGEYISALMRIADLADPVPLVIGAGGTSSYHASASVAGKNGGDSVFGGVLTAIGGLGGTSTNGPAKSWLAGKTGGDGGGETAANYPSSTIRTTSGPGGSSVMGGGGGGSSSGSPDYLAGGTSQFGGDGGDGVTTNNVPATATGGSIPSGGGGGASVNPNSGANLATSGAGARGQCRLTWW